MTEQQILIPMEEVEEIKADKKSMKKQAYGKYGNVKLTDEELAKLKADFPNDYQERIARLDEYIATNKKGKNYTSHYLVIKTWARKNGDTPTVPIQPVPQQPTITQQVLAAMAVTHENVIRRLFVTYGKSADVDRQNAYVSLLKRYPVEVLHTVTEQLMLSEEFLPAVSVVSQRCAAAIDRQRRIEMSQRMTGGGFNV